MTGATGLGRHDAPREPQRGSALVLAVMIMVIMSLMGLAFALVADTENKISLNERHAAQALYVAEGGVRVVKGWFDDPSSGGFFVPTPAQVDRSLRYVDPDGDGTFQAYSSATAPWNVIYRNVTNDLFEKPYRGSPARSFEGDAAHPDVVISDAGSSGERSYLVSLNDSLCPSFPSPTLRARIREIAVYAPPVIEQAGSKFRFGIATIRVTAGIFQNAGTAQETLVGERVVKSLLNEIAYPGPLGPLQSGSSTTATGEFNIHWGDVTAVGSADLSSNLDNKYNSATPWYNVDHFWRPDNTGDGVGDDFDGDSVVDFNEWFDAADNSLEDPWLRFMFGGTLAGAPDDGTANNQPYKFGPARTPPAGVVVDAEHSNIFQHCDHRLFPSIEYKLWKGIALSGGRNVHYYAYDTASGGFRENGILPPQSVEEATYQRNGFFFFDTTDGLPPHDDNTDGTMENLTPALAISGSSWWSGGFLFLNAANLKTTGLGNVPDRNIEAPGEPYVDSNGNGQLDSTEYFLSLDYPGQYTGNHTYDKATWTTPATAPGGVVWNNEGPAIAENVHFYGVIYTSGQWTAKGNAVYYGAVVAKGGVAEDSSAGGTPDIFFDESLLEGNWPPRGLNIPRTFITSWETDM